MLKKGGIAMGVEIERKWLVTEESLRSFPERRKEIYRYADLVQGYLCVHPVVRIRKEEQSDGSTAYVLCYKGKGLLQREEYNLPLTEEAFHTLEQKVEGRLLKKRRYFIPYGKYTIEWDIFQGEYRGLMYAEVEFSSVEEAEAFQAPAWFGRELTEEAGYSNADLALKR